MDNVNTILTSSDANAFFGENGYPLNSLTLETVLRFIALKHHKGNLETIKPIKCSFAQYYEGNRDGYYTSYAKDNNIELLLLTAPRGTQLPYINVDGWDSLDTPPYPVAPFLSAASETRVYTNTEIKSTIIFVRQASERWIDLLCSSLFRVLPWYFADGISEEETALFRAVSKKDTETFKTIINNLCADYDFKTTRFKRILISWDDGYRNKQIETLTARCKDCHANIAHYQELIAQKLNELEQSSLSLAALEAQGNDADDSVYKFFMEHKQISICNTYKNNNGNIMRYCVAETIEYFDADAFTRLYENKHSSVGSAPRDVKEILHAVFAENKGVLRAEGMFELTNLASIIAKKGVTSGQFSDTHIPHPHLYHYGCLGGNSNYINSYLEVGNWDMAIEQTIAAVKNINFGDALVIHDFVEDIRNALGSSSKYVVADNGKEMTLREFLAYIRENKEEEVTKNG